MNIFVTCFLLLRTVLQEKARVIHTPVTTRLRILFNDRWVKGGYLIYTTPAAQSEPYVSLMIQMRKIVSIGQCNKK